MAINLTLLTSKKNNVERRISKWWNHLDWVNKRISDNRMATTMCSNTSFFPKVKKNLSLYPERRTSENAACFLISKTGGLSCCHLCWTMSQFPGVVRRVVWNRKHCVLIIELQKKVYIYIYIVLRIFTSLWSWERSVQTEYTITCLVRFCRPTRSPFNTNNFLQ